MKSGNVRVVVNGYGVIGKRVADAVALQSDMQVSGVADVVSDYRIRLAVERGYPGIRRDGRRATADGRRRQGPRQTDPASTRGRAPRWAPRQAAGHPRLR